MISFSSASVFLLNILVLWSTTKISKTLPRVFAEHDSIHITDPYANESTPLRESMRGRHTGVTLKVLSLDFTENFLLEKFRNFEKLTGVTIEPVRASQTTWPACSSNPKPILPSRSSRPSAQLSTLSAIIQDQNTSGTNLDVHNQHHNARYISTLSPKISESPY